MWQSTRRAAVVATTVALLALGGGVAAAQGPVGQTGEANGLSVNGTALTPGQETTIRRVGAEVLPDLAGESSERIDTAATATWWALKEGVLSAENPWAR